MPVALVLAAYRTHPAREAPHTDAVVLARRATLRNAKSRQLDCVTCVNYSPQRQVDAASREHNRRVDAVKSTHT
jgi:Pyruvate/2-oxoacid:ferredoxin oxidoreductase delta subunit